jgi:hypothetical protein
MNNFQQKLHEAKIDKEYIRKVAIEKFSPQVVACNFLTELEKIISVQKSSSSYKE